VIDERQIEIGRGLRELLSDHRLAPLLKEWEERIEFADSTINCWHSSNAPHILAGAVVEARALRGLRQWINDEIEAGGRELAKKESLAEARTVDV
jgi:hypothetical protein